MGDEYESKFLNGIPCISHVEVKEEVILAENTSDSESTLSDNEKNSDIKQEECEICCKYHSMFIILNNHECSILEGGEKCELCEEISHWLNCFNSHKESHEVDYSSDSTTSDKEDIDGECKVCLKYEFMVPLLSSHICKDSANCQDCNEVLLWTSCYKKHAESHAIKEENLSDSTVSDNEEIQKLLSFPEYNNCDKCLTCLKYQVMFIILEKNHKCMSKVNEKCQECDEIYHWNDCFENHKKSHPDREFNDFKHFGDKFECSICLKLNSIVTSLMKNHTCIENKSCIVCQEVSYWLSCLNNHKRSDLNIADTSDDELDSIKNSWNQKDCAVCAKYHTALINLSNHECRSEKQKCKICIEASFWAKNFKKHENEHYSQILPVKNYLSCCNCGKRFSSEKMLNVHNSYCNTSFICDLCDKRFVDMNSLKKHRVFHSCHNPLNICKICNKNFSNSLELRNHEQNHKNLKLFKFNKCSTSSECSLKNHKKIHR